MIAPEEIVDLGEFLKHKGLTSSPYQIFAARQVLLSEWNRDADAGSLVRLSSLLGPIFCRTAEEQQQFERLYLQWLRQRSSRPTTTSTPKRPEDQQPERPTVHWRMKLAAAGLLIVPFLTTWFLYQDLRTRQVVGQAMADGQPVANATVRLGEDNIATSGTDGTFHLPFRAKDMPLELTIEAQTFLPSKTPVGDSMKTNRNWLYLNPINISDTLNIGEIRLTKEEHESPPPAPDTPDPSTPEPPPSTLSLEKVAVLKVPPPSWVTRLDVWKAAGAIFPLLFALLWLAYRKLRQPGLQRQASRIPPELKRVQVQTGTQHLFPSISLRHLTQRLRQTRFVESSELDVVRTIAHTMNQGGLFTPVYGSRREPGYVALIDRSTMADHQAHLAAQLVRDLAKGYVLILQYEFDEQPTILQRIDPLRPSPRFREGAPSSATHLEVTSLEILQAKFPARRLLCFGDPIICFDSLTGKLRPWVDTLEGWEERYWLTSNSERRWGQAERVLSRRGFQVIPFTPLGLRLLSHLFDQGNVSGGIFQPPGQVLARLHDQMAERWLERHPPSQETITRLLNELQQELGPDGILWLAACAAYPEIHWALTLEWGVRLFGRGTTAETLLPKVTRLVWFRQAYMPDWFRKALYDRLTPREAERISQELSEILSAVDPEHTEGLGLTIATSPGTKRQTASPKTSLRDWVEKLVRKLRLQAMGREAEAGSPLRDYVMLQYLSGKQGKALTPYAPKALLKVLFPKGQPWLGFRPFILPLAAVVATGGLWDWLDPLPVPLPSPMQAVALSSDGNTLAVGMKDGRLVEWDWQAKQVRHRYSGYPFAVTSIAVSNHGNVLVGGYQDGSIHVLEKNGGMETRMLKEHDTPITSLAFWPTPQKIPRLVSVDKKKYVDWYNFMPGKTEGFGYSDITALAFSQSGDWAVGGHSGGQMFTSGTADSDLNAFFNLDLSFTLPEKEHGALKSLAWDPTGRFFMSRHADGMVRILDRRSEQVLANIQGPLEGVSGLSWPAPEEALLSVAGAEGPEIWRLHIPVQLLEQSLATIEEEKAAALKKREEARVREEKPAEERLQTDLAAKKKPREGQQDTKPTTQADQKSAQDPRSYLTQLHQAPSREVISAVSGKETPFEFQDANHGLFTNSLLKGLGDGLADVNKDGYITTLELYRFVKAETSSEASKRRTTQIPSLLNLSGDQGAFLFNNPRLSSGRGQESLKKDLLSTGKALALIIGIDNYEQIPKLKLAVEDARGVGNLFEKFEFSVDYLLNAEATRSNILQKVFEALSENAGNYERVLIYFSGHGKSVIMPNSGESFSHLLPVDVDPDKILITGIRLNELLDMARVSLVKHVLFLLDAPVPVGGVDEILIQSGVRQPDRKNKDEKMPKATRPVPQQQEQNVPEPTGGQQQETQTSIPQQQEAPQQIKEPPIQAETRPSRITGKDGAPMVLVPAGEFTMGARDDDKGAFANERPAHPVYLDAFYIDQYEVTTSRYAKFFQETKRDPPQYWTETVPKQHSKKPVVGVTWDDAKAYCEWAGKRLPTEAEWEKAARGTDGRLYPWGNEPPTKKLANFDNCCDFKDYGILSDVGSFEGGKSPYGAYEMAGNVWEWVADLYDGNLNQPMANEITLFKFKNTKNASKVLRGGSWVYTEPRYLRTSNLYRSNPVRRDYDFGFRCAQGAS